MDVEAPGSVVRAFAGLKDPRMNRTKKHSLLNILTIAICSVLCGADGWVQVEEYGEALEDWFKTFLDLPHGIPSHDTFGRVFAALDPAAFEQCFMNWINGLAQATAGQLIAIDGKTIRRSLDVASGKLPIHLVSAWSAANHLVLGQLATEAKSNEITAIPKLLELLDIRGAVVTIDAEGCHKKIAGAIVAGGGDYLLQLKGNQPLFHKEVVDLFDRCLTDDCHGIAYSTAKSLDKGHGRIEERRLWATSEIGWFAEASKWKNLRSLIRVQARRTVNGQTSSEYHYYISSLPADNASKLLAYVRGHWGIENSLHWCLDMQFREDERRIRQGNAAENFARLSRIAMNLLKAQSHHKVGIATKRKCCGWSQDYLLRVLTGQPVKR